jgi:glycosyltransferase involved in cell wall biosynthesis
MKVLFDHRTPFILAHGGLEIQIEQTKIALQQIGVAVDYLRWWDAAQQCDVVHFFGRPDVGYIELAQKKGIKIVVADLLTGLGSRSAKKLAIQRLAIQFMQRALPDAATHRFGWESYRMADACVALTQWEASLIRSMFNVPADRVHIVPNGVEQEFFRSARATRGPWLVCTATIDPRKRVLEVAQAAVEAQVPIWIIGKPYSERDEYVQAFFRVARDHPEIVRYEGPIADRDKLATIYREARGFVLLSDRESLSLSALEAATCECPLLLSDLPWAKTTFRDAAMFCPVTTISQTASVMKRFYETAPNQKIPSCPYTWLDVAKQLQTLYEQLLKTSR